MSDEKDIKEMLASIPPEERAKAWEDYVRGEVNKVLDIYLPEAANGNIGIQYDKPVKMIDPKSGKKIIDENKAKGVMIVVDLEFAETIEFFPEGKPEE